MPSGTDKTTAMMVALLEQLALESSAEGRRVIAMAASARSADDGSGPALLGESAPALDDATILSCPRQVEAMAELFAERLASERKVAQAAIEEQDDIIRALTAEVGELVDEVGYDEGVPDDARYVNTTATVARVRISRVLLLQQLTEERNKHEAELSAVEASLQTELRIQGLPPLPDVKRQRQLLRGKHEIHEAEDANTQATVEEQLLQEAQQEELARLRKLARDYRQKLLLRRLEAEERELAEAEEQLREFKASAAGQS